LGETYRPRPSRDGKLFLYPIVGTEERAKWSF
jgi:hypothetical protein